MCGQGSIVRDVIERFFLVYMCLTSIVSFNFLFFFKTTRYTAWKKHKDTSKTKIEFVIAKYICYLKANMFSLTNARNIL